MLPRIIILSLIITAIHVCTWNGMILHKPAEFIGGILDWLQLSILRKPLWECQMCMGGIWTLAIYPLLYGLSWDVVPVMLGVIGLNTIIAAAICRLHE